MKQLQETTQALFGRSCCRRVRIEKTHRVQVSCRRTKCIDWQSEYSPSSLPVLASAQEADHGGASETRTASGRSDDHSSPGFHVADAEYLGGSLAPAVLSGGWCALAPQNSLRGSAQGSIHSHRAGRAKLAPPQHRQPLQHRQRAPCHRPVRRPIIDTNTCYFPYRSATV
jgi:hypothetical protein